MTRRHRVLFASILAVPSLAFGFHWFSPAEDVPCGCMPPLPASVSEVAG